MARYAVTTGGIRLAYDAAGTGEPGLLFVHGWCCDRSYFAPQFDHFAARHAVASLDLRGHGDSDRPEPTPGGYGIEALADDALTVARAAGLANPVVIGHSLGALVALACAARPGTVRAAVLVDPAPLFPGGRVKSFFERSVPDVAADADGSWRRAFAARLFLPTDTVRRAEVLAAMGRPPVAVAAAAFEGMARFDGAAALDRVRVPVLCVQAGEGERGLRDYRAVTVGRTVGAGHFNHLEVPDQVNPMIERFLAIHAGAAGAAGEPSRSGAAPR